MKKLLIRSKLTPPQQWGLVILRILIGWHFLYEGIIKLIDNNWTAESYLMNTRGVFSGLFHAMASHPAILDAVNFLNVWGLIFIGLGLFMGMFARSAVYAACLLLTFYYLAYPPIHGYNFGAPQEGHYLLVNKTLIELLAVTLLALFPQTLPIGIWSLLKKIKVHIPLPVKFKQQPHQPKQVKHAVPDSRREMLKHLAFVPFLGGFTWAFMNDKNGNGPDGYTGSTIQLKQRNLSEIEGSMPMGTLVKGKKPISRLIMGTNHLSGNAHARDLKYARSLFKAYNTEKKIIETYLLAQQAGINLFFATPLLEQCRKIYGGDFQTWLNVAPTKDNLYSQVDQAIDKGVDYIFIQGAACDRRIFDGQVDVIVKCVEYIKQQGFPVGLGAHTIQAMQACVDAGIDPDFYYKTMHHDRYWSAHPKENRYPYLWSANTSEDHNKFHDNMWCLFPEETVNFVREAKKPVVGFKVLAGGALLPEDGFKWAFDNGADFIEVGMFDFQIVENVMQAIKCVENAQNRTRPWYG